MKWRLDDGQIEVVDDAVAAILRKKTPAQRVAMVFDCNATMRKMVAGRLRARHPDWSDSQIQQAVAQRMTRESS